MKHTAVIRQKPVRSGKHSIPDGALNGNGDLGVVLGSSGKGVRIFLSKVDFWLSRQGTDQNGGMKLLGYLDIDIPGSLYENYYAEQRMDSGEIFCRFAHGQTFMEITLFVYANANDIIIEIKHSRDFPYCEPKLHVTQSGTGKTETYTKDGISFIARSFETEDLCFATKGIAGLKKISASPETKQYAVGCLTNHNSACPEREITAFLGTCSAEVIEDIKKAHARWWKDFYGKSSMEIADEELEMNWYASQYILAVSARNQHFPPGLYGNFITIDNVNWYGDYHLNYNYEAPFYGLCSSNHPELTDCYHAPLLAFMDRGRDFAKTFLGCDGIFYPVGLGPMGMDTSVQADSKEFGELFLGQKSNASYGAVVMVMRWRATRDEQYARTVAYPYLKAVGSFWESYLKFEKGRYVICNDAIHEVAYYKGKAFNPRKRENKKHIHDFNNLLSLGLVRMVFSNLLDMSEALGTDSDRRKQWAHILAHISDYPVFRKKLKKVFRYTEKGMAWHDTNFLCLQHVYPVSQLSPEKDKALLDIARNTFFINDRWQDDNASSSVYPCAARLRLDGKLILEKLKAHYKAFLLPNMLFLHGGGCIENNSTTAAAINEMVLQSYEDIIRFYPAWDKTLDCRYRHLRADGAFLISAELKDGVMQWGEIISERGGCLQIENPYDRCRIADADGERVYTDRVICLDTEKAERITLCRA